MEIEKDVEYIDAENVLFDSGYVGLSSHSCPSNYARYANTLTKQQTTGSSMLAFNCIFDTDVWGLYGYNF